MTAAATLATWLLIFGAYACLAGLVVAFFYGAFRNDRSDFEDHGRERVGMISSTDDGWDEYLALLARKRDRAEARHHRRAG